MKDSHIGPPELESNLEMGSNTTKDRTLAQPTRQIRQLAPFILMSLLLHVVLLTAIHPPANNYFVAKTHPMKIYLPAPAVTVQAPIPDKSPREKHNNQARLSAAIKTHIAPLATQSVATLPAAPPPAFNSQLLMESAKSIARDDAKKAEQNIAALEKKRPDTPAGLLEQYLRQPHQEIRLANGMLKIVTDAGTVCFQPVPNFARDMPGLFGIPTTCP